MSKGESNSQRIGSVKAAIDLFGERIAEDNSPQWKPKLNFSEPSPRTRELHLARRDINRLGESTMDAESVKAQAESELSCAKQTVRGLRLRIEESNAIAKVQIQDLEKLKKPKRSNQEHPMDVKTRANDQYVEVLRELKCVKEELLNLKLGVSSVLAEKRQAERDTEVATSKQHSYSNSVQAIKKGIEELNEEQVLVELARIEALKELKDIEARRREESEKYSSALEDARKKLNNCIQEINHAEELEAKLMITTADINMLQNELRQVKEMDKKAQRTDSLRHQEASSRVYAESDSPDTLELLAIELEAAKKELACIKIESFRLMASMDIIRNELKHVSEHMAQVKKKEEKASLAVENLNSKLLRTKAKLEAASAAEEKARSILSNLSTTVEQLKTEAEMAKNGRLIIGEETATLNTHVQKTDLEIDIAEEKLEAALQELEAVKLSEAIALDNLKHLTEKTMNARASVSKHSTRITISKFEYEYLIGHAAAAEEIADMKVAAAQAWIEALKASESETSIKTEIAQRKIKHLKLEEEQETYKTAQLLSAKRPLPRKSTNKSGNVTPARKAKIQKSASPGVRNTPRSTPVTIRRRGKILPNLAKFFSGKKSRRDKDDDR